MGDRRRKARASCRKSQLPSPQSIDVSPSVEMLRSDWTQTRIHQISGKERVWECDSLIDSVPSELHSEEQLDVSPTKPP